jgi:hypothetical protein
VRVAYPSRRRLLLSISLFSGPEHNAPPERESKHDCYAALLLHVPQLCASYLLSVTDDALPQRTPSSLISDRHSLRNTLNSSPRAGMPPVMCIAA